MKAQSIQQIQDLPPKGLVYAFEATVGKIFNRSEGQNDHGPWSIQSFMAKDAAGDEIKVMLKDREPFPFAQGSVVRIEAIKGDKGYSGVYAEDDTYKGKTSRILKVTPTGVIDRLQASGRQERREEPAPSRDKDLGWPPERQDEAPPRQAPREEPRDERRDDPQGPAKAPASTKRTILQVANLYLECMLATRYVADTYKKQTGQDMSDSQRQACASSLFIKADRLNLHAEMPATKLAID